MCRLLSNIIYRLTASPHPAIQPPQPPATIPHSPIPLQPLLALLRALVCDMWDEVQGISALSLAWLSKLAPALASLAVYRAAAEQDNADAVAVLQVRFPCWLSQSCPNCCLQVLRDRS